MLNLKFIELKYNSKLYIILYVVNQDWIVEHLVDTVYYTIQIKIIVVKHNINKIFITTTKNVNILTSIIKGTLGIFFNLF